MTGIKDDKNKPAPRLVLGTMARAIVEVSKVATFGAEKYSADNWLKVDNGIERYTDAKDRHRLEGAISELDQESGLLHAAHEAWNALAVLELKLRAIESSAEQQQDWPTDDRIDAIGQNGNDGTIYEYRDLEKPETWVKGDIVISQSGHEYLFEEKIGDMLSVRELDGSLQGSILMRHIQQVKAQ